MKRSKVTRLILALLVCMAVLSCTTLKVRNQQIIDEYKAINLAESIDETEALKIVRYYMHIQHSYYGLKYFYTDKPKDFGKYWQFSTEFRNSNYENNADDVFFVSVDKKGGKVSSRVIRAGIDDDKQSALRKRNESIVISDGIDRQEAIARVKYHYFIEAKNQYSHYLVKFTPIETNKYWVFELNLRNNSPIANQKLSADFKKSSDLYLVVNKKTGELFKERTYLKLIQ